jgi:hypothetical protein
MAAEQKQIVEVFFDTTRVDDPIKNQLQDYLDENPGFRVVSMVASSNLDKLLVVLEPVAEEAKGCSAVLACPMVHP